MGDGIADPLHTDFASSHAILQRLKALRPKIKVFGYVPIGLDPEWTDSNLTLPQIYTKIDEWYNMGATHIFLDEFGYDYFVTRERQNACVKYCKDLGMNVC